MNSKMLDFMKSKNYVISGYILKNYKALNISLDEFVLLVYLMNFGDVILCDYNLFSSELSMDKNNILILINDLVEHKLIEIKVNKNSNNKLVEHISLDLLYNKFFLDLIKEDKEESNIYATFEKELGRSLSPMEYEFINGWLDCNYKEEVIIEALKEAVYSGVSSFRYVDKILFEWNKKNIDTIEKVRNRVKPKEKKESVEIPDYDWLNHNE